MRYASIDLLRAVALVLMVVIHFLENLSGATWWPGSLGAPLFTFLSGVSFRLWVQGQEAAGVPDEQIVKVAVRRGLFLFTLGFVFNVLVWLPDDVYNWDVLTLIGTGQVLLVFVRHLPNGLFLFAASGVFLLAPFLRLQADYPAHWTDGYFDCDHSPADILIGYLATGYFPVFPWLMFPLVGYVVGRVMFPDPTERGTNPPVRPVAVAGLGLLIAGAALGYAEPSLSAPYPQLLGGWTMFPASAEYTASCLGFCLLAFAVLHEWVDRRNGLRRWPGLLSVAGTLSRYSLTAYLLHHALHLWPLWVYGLVAGAEPTQFWRTAASVESAAVLSVLCLVGCYGLFRLMARHGWPGAESLMRWICD